MQGICILSRQHALAILMALDCYYVLLDMIHAAGDFSVDGAHNGHRIIIHSYFWWWTETELHQVASRDMGWCYTPSRGFVQQLPKIVAGALRKTQSSPNNENMRLIDPQTHPDYARTHSSPRFRQLVPSLAQTDDECVGVLKKNCLLCPMYSYCQSSKPIRSFSYLASSHDSIYRSLKGFQRGLITTYGGIQIHSSTFHTKRSKGSTSLMCLTCILSAVNLRRLCTSDECNDNTAEKINEGRCRLSLHEWIRGTFRTDN